MRTLHSTQQLSVSSVAGYSAASTAVPASTQKPHTPRMSLLIIVTLRRTPHSAHAALASPTPRALSGVHGTLAASAASRLSSSRR